MYVTNVSSDYSFWVTIQHIYCTSTNIVCVCVITNDEWIDDVLSKRKLFRK